jgi:two-component system cell cycle sensor histidine kinase/response regulator CckA
LPDRRLEEAKRLLGVIIGYAGLVLQEPLVEPVRAKVEQTLKAVERAAGLTRQLLAFSHKNLLEPTVLDLNALVSDTQPMLQRLVREDIELATTLGPQLGTVRADRGQIEQVPRNLVANARDAKPEGGRLTIATANVDLDPSYAATHPPVAPGRYVILALSDTGEGMDPETQAHLLEPFFTTKELGKGTGLGLATVYGVVKQSGGHVSVYSELGVGTTFKIYLRWLDEEVTVPRQPDPALRSGRRGDRPGRRGREPGPQGPRGWRRHRGSRSQMWSCPASRVCSLPDILAPARPETRVLFISGYTDGASLQRGLPGPGPAFLSKPFSPEAFLRKVREVLDGVVRQDPS